MNLGRTKPAAPTAALLTEDQLYHVSQEALNTPDEEGRTLLHRAVRQGAIELVDILLKRRAAVNVGDGLGSTPLHEAVADEQILIIARLLDAGADVNARDAALRSPLCFAVQLGFGDVAEMLLERGADPNTQDLLGHTPLHEAVEANQFSLLAVLLRRRANAALTAKDGKTPLDLAKSKGHKAMVDVLQRYQSATPVPVAAPEPAPAPAAPGGLSFDSLCDAMLEAVPGSVYVLDVDGVFTFISGSAARKLGVAAAALVGTRWSTTHFPAQAEEVFDHRRIEVMGSGQPATGVMRLTVNGVIYGYRYTVAPVRDADGAAVGVMVVMHDDAAKTDLEERLSRANYALHETEMKLGRERAARQQLEEAGRGCIFAARLLAALPVPVITLDAAGCVVALNPAATAATQVQETDARERPLWDALVTREDADTAAQAFTDRTARIPRLTLIGDPPYTAAWTQTCLYVGDELEFVVLSPESGG